MASLAPFIPLVTAVAGLGTAGAAVFNAFNKPKSSAPPVTAPTVTQAPAPGATDAQKLGALALISSSPQGVSSANTSYGRSQLLGS